MQPFEFSEAQCLETGGGAQGLAEAVEVVGSEAAASQVEPHQLALGILQRLEQVVEAAAVAAVAAAARHVQAHDAERVRRHAARQAQPVVQVETTDAVSLQPVPRSPFARRSRGITLSLLFPEQLINDPLIPFMLIYSHTSSLFKC